MSSVGEVDRWLRVVRTYLDAFNTDFENAINAVAVPEEVQHEVRARYQEQIAQPIRRARVLSGEGGPKPWFRNWRPSEGYYWRRQRQYLIDQVGRGEHEVDLLDDSSDKVLSHLEDSRESGPETFRVVGLAVGYIQSGKTANFSAVIAKAADLGYKLVIVLSGIHNSLRQQTQRRLSRELGLEPAPPGVGLPDQGRRWVTLTTSVYHGDFDPGTCDPNVLQGNERVLLVVKKNATVLRRLVGWMDDRAPPDLPVLIIDDEADLASINTRGNRRPLIESATDDDVDLQEATDLDERDLGEVAVDQELDPSVINGLIRDLTASFRRVSFVGYTATPFSNLFIDPEAVDRTVLEDLYPRDFIVSLPRPPGYVGPERLFGRDELDEEDNPVDGLDVIELVPDVDVDCLLPPRRVRQGAWAPSLPPSLQQALMDYFLATAARMYRSGQNLASSMLIHASQRIWVQDLVGELVREEIRAMRRDWRYGTRLKPLMRQRWEDDFRPLTASLDVTHDAAFEDIELHIDQLFDHYFREGMGVLVFNSASPDPLDYEINPGTKVIVVGGNRLSRGLTLEELVVSYYVREAATYDTLLQMGRWFGYREAYVDLTRLWTTEDLASRFRHLALVEEEVRDAVGIYEREELTPREFGVRVRSHPAMMITAANKMGSARQVQQSYSGERLQTTRFRLTDRLWLEANLFATRDFLSSLGPPVEGLPQPKWRDVGWEPIRDFLDEYQTAQGATSFDARAARLYISKQAEQHGELILWTVRVMGAIRSVERLKSESLGINGIDTIACIERSRKRIDKDSIGALVSPRDEEHGLTTGQIEHARAGYADGHFPTVGHAMRAQRDPAEGLMLLYPVSRFSRPGTSAGQSNRIDLFDDPEQGVTVIGVALMFPRSLSAATIEYFVGPAGQSEDEDVD